jgi:hypothetical protein
MENYEQNELLPDFLYHYYSYNEHTESIFTKNKVYFQSPREFNDPFDTKCKYVFEGSEQEKKSFLLNLQSENPERISAEITDYVLSHPNGEKEFLGRMDYLDPIRRNVGIYCLTAKNNSILMWSHYADSHKGFCIKFSTTNNFFVKAFKIYYTDQLPVNNILSPNTVNQTEKEFLSKADDWAYEEEYRIIESRGAGTYPFPDNALTGVIFGCRMESQYKNQIIQWCCLRNHRPHLFIAIPKESNYGLNIQPLEYPMVDGRA